MGQDLLGLRACPVTFIEPPLDECTIISLQINTVIKGLIRKKKKMIIKCTKMSTMVLQMSNKEKA